MSTRVFISYGREDAATARRLYDDLAKAGLGPWLDEKDLLAGQKWRETIPKAIKECRYFLALLSSQSLSKRGYVQKELKTALDILDEFPQDEIFVIPVRVDECEPQDERLKDLHQVDLFPNYAEGLKKILRAFRAVNRPGNSTRL